MDFKQVAFNMLPFWVLGFSIILFAINSKYKDLMKFDKNALLYFLKLMAMVTIFRFISMGLFPPSKASAAPVLGLPLPMVLFVPWEDAVFCLPLAILSRKLGDLKHKNFIMWPLILLSQISFMAGHVYEGIGAAIFLSFYIPIVKKIGEKHGFATTMICHIIYDLLTILTLRLFVGM